MPYATFFVADIASHLIVAIKSTNTDPAFFLTDYLDPQFLE